MAHQQTYTCDGCGVAKGDSGNWLVATASKSVAFYPWTSLLAVNDAVNHYAYVMKTEPEQIYHFCGIGCATKKLSSVVEDWNNA